MLLLLSMTIPAFLIGWLVFGLWGALVGLGIAAAVIFWSFRGGDEDILLAYNAMPTQDYKLVNMTKRLANEAGIPEPTLYMVKTSSYTPNAFSIGKTPDNSSICLTGPVLSLRDDEIEAVIAHEIAHIRNRDGRIRMMSAKLAGRISRRAQSSYQSLFLYGDFQEETDFKNKLSIMISAPIAALVIRIANPGEKEFETDYLAARLSMKPRALASALRKIEEDVRRRPVKGNAPVSTAHLWTVNPLHDDWFTRLFSTHPRTEERIKRLLDMDVSESI